MTGTVACRIAAPCLLPATACAADFPRHGAASSTTTSITSSSPTMSLGPRETTGEDRHVKCDCTEVDHDGDQVFATYQAKRNRGAGIPIAGPDNTRMSIATHHATWTLP